MTRTTRTLPGVPLVALRLVGLLLAGLWPSAAEPYVQQTYMGTPLAWADPEATLTLGLLCSPGPDPCYHAAVVAAAADWNAVGAQFTFHTTSYLADPCAHGDRRNTVSFSSTQCGMDFPPDVLAVTITSFFPSGEIVEADVVFNLGLDADFSWAAYAGPRRASVIDFSRVALHEFGHVFGLDHPDEHGQVVQAIMNSKTSDLDRLQADDIEGIHAIYGRAEVSTAPRGFLENPGDGSAKSGIGLISGWVCDATRVEVATGNTRIPVVYGTSRGDTASVCGDTNNGFVTLVNWNLFGDGVHTVRALADGVEFGRAEFQVTTFGQEFVRDVRGRYALPDFPYPGSTAVIEWDERSQNFVIVGTE